MSPSDVSAGTGLKNAVKVTEREAEVLSLLAGGQSNRAIADVLCISVDTVKYHCKNLYTKFGANSRHAVVLAAVSAGAITPPKP